MALADAIRGYFLNAVLRIGDSERWRVARAELCLKHTGIKWLLEPGQEEELRGPELLIVNVGLRVLATQHKLRDWVMCSHHISTRRLFVG